MKFLYVGDPHNQVRTPANRTDNFHETFKNKVEEIKKIAKEEDVKAILQPGDFLNSPQYNNDFILDVVRLWSFVPEKYQLLEDLRAGKGDATQIAKRLQEDIPYIGAIGNHELIGESYKSYPRTSLAFMEKIGFMKMASREEPIIFEDEDGTKVAITATHYHHGMDEPEFVDDYIIDKKAGDVHIHMVHGYLAHKSLGDLITHTLVDSIKDTEADLTISGHDHIGFKPVEINGKVFSNPGSMTRTKADIKEIGRQPKVLLIEVKDGKVTVEERELKSAPEGSKVLDRTAILKKASKSSKIESIKSIVNKAKLSKGQDVTDIIESVAEADSIEREVIDNVVERVTDKMEEMGKSQTATVQGYNISQIILNNFQSHEYSVFDVSDKLNIFTGESSNGKSAIMRAMRWLMDNSGRSQRESFIRHGADSAKVTAVLDNGKMITRVIHRQAHKDNGWEVFDPMTGETHKGNTKMLEEIQEHFGFTKVKYDVNDELDINFMNQGDGWYFIGDDITASKRAKIIGSIFGTHYTDAVMRDLERELRETRQKTKVREEDLEKTQKRISGFDYLDELGNKLEIVEKKVEKIESLAERKERIERLVERKSNLDNQKEKLTKIIDSSNGLSEASTKLQALVDKNAHYQQVLDILKRRTVLIREGREQRALTEKLQDINLVSDKYDDLKLLGDKFTQVSTLISKSDITKKELNVLKKTVKSLEPTEVIKDKLSQLEKMNQRAEALQTLILKRNNVLSKANKEREVVNAREIQIITLQDEYKNLLDDYGHCPTCGQTVDNEALDSHLVHSH